MISLRVATCSEPKWPKKYSAKRWLTEICDGIHSLLLWSKSLIIFTSCISVCHTWKQVLFIAFNHTKYFFFGGKKTITRFISTTTARAKQHLIFVSELRISNMGQNKYVRWLNSTRAAHSISAYVYEIRMRICLRWNMEKKSTVDILCPWSHFFPYPT
jgi:hypothetical protein